MTARGRGITEIVVGPVHAGIIEPGRFTIGTAGETIASFETQFGFAHRGVERALQGRGAVEAAKNIARVCGGCSVARSWAYARAIEGLAGIRIDEAGEIARVLFAELERIYNHLFDLGAACAGAGYAYGRTTALGLVERVHRICAQTGGHRFLFDAVVPGGVRSGFPRDPGTARNDLRTLASDAERFLADVFANESLSSRFERAGALTLDAVRETGGVGPARRACGDASDVRVDQPYGAYERLRPLAAVHCGGDVAARVRVKTDELRESFRLARLALEELEGTRLATPQAIETAEGWAIGLTEGPRGAETVEVRCDARGALQTVRIVSASARNWPLVARAMEGNIVPDFPLVNKSFNLCYACADL